MHPAQPRNHPPACVDAHEPARGNPPPSLHRLGSALGTPRTLQGPRNDGPRTLLAPASALQPLPPGAEPLAPAAPRQRAPPAPAQPAAIAKGGGAWWPPAGASSARGTPLYAPGPGARVAPTPATPTAYRYPWSAPPAAPAAPPAGYYHHPHGPAGGTYTYAPSVAVPVVLMHLPPQQQQQQFDAEAMYQAGRRPPPGKGYTGEPHFQPGSDAWLWGGEEEPEGYGGAASAAPVLDRRAVQAATATTTPLRGTLRGQQHAYGRMAALAGTAGAGGGSRAGGGAWAWAGPSLAVGEGALGCAVELLADAEGGDYGSVVELAGLMRRGW